MKTAERYRPFSRFFVCRYEKSAQKLRLQGASGLPLQPQAIGPNGTNVQYITAVSAKHGLHFVHKAIHTF